MCIVFRVSWHGDKKEQEQYLHGQPFTLGCVFTFDQVTTDTFHHSHLGLHSSLVIAHPRWVDQSLKFVCWIHGMWGLDVLRLWKILKVRRSQSIAFSIYLLFKVFVTPNLKYIHCKHFSSRSRLIQVLWKLHARPAKLFTLSSLINSTWTYNSCTGHRRMSKKDKNTSYSTTVSGMLHFHVKVTQASCHQGWGPTLNGY